MISGKPERWFRHKDASWGRCSGFVPLGGGLGAEPGHAGEIAAYDAYAGSSTSDRLIYRDVTAMGHFIVYRGESLVGINKFYF